MKTLIQNRRAKFDYEITETFESGIVLLGKEVKSIKNGQARLDGSYAFIGNGEMTILNMYISPYQPKNTMGAVEPDRSRKLLLRKKEINYLIGKLKEKRFALVPLKVYLKKGKIKLELGLGRGKTKIDKRETIKKREAKREMSRRFA
jgi:SsrA-binding protein